MLQVNSLNPSRSMTQPLTMAGASVVSNNPFAAQKNDAQMGLGRNVQDMAVTNFGKKGVANTIAIA
jgi:hypothetical protein